MPDFQAAPPALHYGFDVGGTSIKYAAVDVSTGTLHGTLQHIATPQPATPVAISTLIRDVLHRTPEDNTAETIGVALPSVVQDGTTLTAANVDPSWQGFEAADFLTLQTGHGVAVLNDADAAGIAEMRFGAGRGSSGTTLLITLGTGIGSALFVNGQLVPNTELGHLHLNGTIAEHWASAVTRERQELSWEQYAQRLQSYLSHLEHLFSPDLVIIGGGISAVSHNYLPRLNLKAQLQPATLGNAAGVIGAAAAATGQNSMDPIGSDQARTQGEGTFERIAALDFART